METPVIVSEMRSLNMGLSILVYENKLKLKDLKHFSRDELDLIRTHTTIESIKKRATLLLKSS